MTFITTAFFEMREELRQGLLSQEEGSILTISSIALLQAHMKSPV